MTEDGKFLSKADFRENATEKDYENLWNFYQSGTKNFPTKKEPKPDCPYQFGATSAKELLDERKQKKTGSVKAEKTEMEEGGINITTELQFAKTKLEYTKRSLQLTQDHWDRLQKLFDAYPIVNKNYVLQAVLEDALTRFGV